MLIRAVVCWMFVAIAQIAFAQQAPLPKKLLEAKTAFVVNVLSNTPGSLGVGTSTVTSGTTTASGVSVVGTESKFYIRINDARDGTPLWSDQVGEAVLVSNSPKKLVSNLRKRFESQEKKKKK